MSNCQNVCFVWHLTWNGQQKRLSPGHWKTIMCTGRKSCTLIQSLAWSATARRLRSHMTSCTLCSSSRFGEKVFQVGIWVVIFCFSLQCGWSRWQSLLSAALFQLSNDVSQAWSVTWLLWKNLHCKVKANVAFIDLLLHIGDIEHRFPWRRTELACVNASKRRLACQFQPSAILMLLANGLQMRHLQFFAYKPQRIVQQATWASPWRRCIVWSFSHTLTSQSIEETWTNALWHMNCLKERKVQCQPVTNN